MMAGTAGMIVPEGIIEDLLQKGLEYVRKDYRDNSDKTKTLLYRMTDNQSIGSFNYTNQMVATIITENKDGSKHIRVKQSYDPSDTNYPGVYVNMNEETDSRHSSLSQGYGDAQETQGSPGYFDDDEGTFSQISGRTFDASFYVTVISDNKNEVIGLYQFFKQLLMMLRTDIETSGLVNSSIGGKGITFDTRVPPGIHIKVITLSFMYDLYAPEIFGRTIPSTINLEGMMLGLND